MAIEIILVFVIAVVITVTKMTTSMTTNIAVTIPKGKFHPACLTKMSTVLVTILSTVQYSYK